MTNSNVYACHIIIEILCCFQKLTFFSINFMNLVANAVIILNNLLTCVDRYFEYNGKCLVVAKMILALICHIWSTLQFNHNYLTNYSTKRSHIKLTKWLFTI
jgi:hypothetical protein